MNFGTVIGLENLNFQNQFSSCCVCETWICAAGVYNVSCFENGLLVTV